MTLSSNPITTLRLKLAANGYSPIPVTSPDPNDPQAGKKPAIRDWVNPKARTPEEIASWEFSYSNAGNTGLVCGHLVGIDIDVDDEVAANLILDAVLELLGAGAPVRFGRKPRALILCRTEVPFKKKFSKEFVLPTGLLAKVEILAEGQQCVVGGIHPKTGSPYVWRDISPMNVPFDHLPLVDEARLAHIIKSSEDTLHNIGAQSRDEVAEQEKKGKARAQYRSGPVDPAVVSEALEFIPNDAAHYDFWLRVGFALHNGLGEAGFKLWNDWSKQSKKHNDAFTLKTWEHFKQDGGITIGSLFFHATQNGWRRAQQDGERSVVYVVTGKLHEAVDAAEQALINSPIEIFQRGGALVRPVRAPISDRSRFDSENLKLLTVTEDWLSETFMRVAQFQRVKEQTGEVVPMNCPPQIVKAYLSRVGEWCLPVLKGLVHAPTMRADGSIISSAGYDQASCLYADFDPVLFADTPQSPDKTEALRALASLKSFFNTFPFVSDADRSVAIAAILTGLTRHLFPTAPLFGYSAPVAGSGKSLLVDLTSIILTGLPASVLSPGRTQEELEKRLGAALIQGASVISLDNCTDTVFSAFLCQVVTQSRVQTRILGQSKNVEVLTNTLLLATGNNLTFAEDMTRRVLLCSLDPEVERPEERQFDIDIVAEVKRYRGQIVASCLTLLRAFFLAGMPKTNKTLGSFAEWSKFIPAVLVWLGEADPFVTVERVRDNDPVLARNQSLLNEIDALFGPRPFTVAELITEAKTRDNGTMGGYVYAYSELHQILSEFSGGKDSLDASRIGKALWKLDGRRYGSMMLKRLNGRGGKRRWQLIGATQKGVLNIF